ncbi:MAG: flagellar export chaperone FliS [Sulfurimonadaceae bacterium]|nr:flagellar export chaperone FliS [Sulfurimonadaceae bacterium]
MYRNNLAYNTYAQNNASIESPHKLIEMLYEGILRFNVMIKKAIADDDTEKRAYWTNRCTAIFSELISSLDYSQGDVAHYLNGLYSYQMKLLFEASLHNDATKIDEVNQVVKGLLEAWREETHVAEEL